MYCPLVCLRWVSLTCVIPGWWVSLTCVIPGFGRMWAVLASRDGRMRAVLASRDGRDLHRFEQKVRDLHRFEQIYHLLSRSMGTVSSVEDPENSDDQPE